MNTLANEDVDNVKHTSGVKNIDENCFESVLLQNDVDNVNKSIGSAEESEEIDHHVAYLPRCCPSTIPNSLVTTSRDEDVEVDDLLLYPNRQRFCVVPQSDYNELPTYPLRPSYKEFPLTLRPASRPVCKFFYYAYYILVYMGFRLNSHFQFLMVVLMILINQHLCQYIRLQHLSSQALLSLGLMIIQEVVIQLVLLLKNRLQCLKMPMQLSHFQLEWQRSRR